MDAIEKERELQMKTEIYDRIKDGTPFTRQLLKEAVRIGVDLTNINTSEITDMSELFIHSNEIIGVITHWDTSKVTAMNGTFRRAKNFNQPLEWDTSKVWTMSNMFLFATAFNHPLDFDTSNVIDMGLMFMGAEHFNQPLDWDTSQVVSMDSMFMSAFAFDQVLDWDTSQAKDREDMFVGSMGSFKNDNG